MTMSDGPVDGWWWLPQSDGHRVFGRLIAGRAGRWELDVFGALDGNSAEVSFERLGEDEGNVPVIHGHLMGGGSAKPRFISLLDCWLRTANRTVGGVVSGAVTETWAFGEIVTGHDHVGAGELASAMTVRLSGLLEWTGRGSPEASWSEETATASAEAVHLGTAEVDDLKIDLILDHSLDYTEHSVTVSHCAMFSVVPRTPLTLDEAMAGVAIPLRDLVSFMSLGHIEIESVEVRIENDAERRHPWFDYAVSLQRPHDEPSRVRRHEMLATWSDLAADLQVQELIGRWWELRRSLEKTITMLLVPVYAPYLYTDDHVLTAFIALESYHAVQVGGTAVPPQQHAERVDSIVASAPAEWRTWANDMLRGRNQKGLPRRVSDIVQRSGTTGQAVLEAVPDFVSLAVKGRQSTAHPGFVGGDAGTRYLAISYGLRWILRRCLLEDMGLRPSRADELVKRCRKFSSDLDLMRRWTN